MLNVLMPVSEGGESRLLQIRAKGFSGCGLISATRGVLRRERHPSISP